jgi:ArsR family transcriptional regulator, lead/cadmium/zinc/bismuth-responsive transcriptional repressor
VARSEPPKLKNPERVARARARVAASAAEDGLDRVRQALCEPARVRIVQALGTGELCVDDLAAAIGRAPAATSQHLRVLRELGLVESARRGTTIYYHLRAGPDAAQVQQILAVCERSVAVC